MHSFEEHSGRLPWFHIPMLVAAGVVVVAAWVVYNPLSLLEPPPEAVREPRDTSEIELADLSESFDAVGSLDYEQTWTISHPAGGTITEIDPGSGPVTTGDVLYRVDDAPTVAVIGSTPAYRTLDIDSVGDDVLQMEIALVEMGYDSGNLLNVDGVYTTYTSTLVEAWQDDAGLDVTGRVDYGTVVFVPEGLSMGSVVASVGDQADRGSILGLQGQGRIVRFDIPVDDLESVPVGSIVEARLPDRTPFEAEVTGLINAGSGVWTLTAMPLELPDTSTAAQIPVDVSWERTVVDQARVVRAGALRRLDTGVYAVEVVGSSDLDTQLVAVEVGRQSGSLVELLDGPAVGTAVIEP